ncbi:hypothetical protein BJX68DRAFT_270838 [Aspergillus pseudodeflectus]|uniref:Uncharacterized protein n=1 Tax=Aspergillus pseudodeflectus TaxID=176178 RepID=A0ABR4JQ14_9EURO
MADSNQIRIPELIKTYVGASTGEQAQQTLMDPEKHSTEAFTSKVENVPGPVFVFLPPNSKPLSLETRRFATAHRQLTVYGITHPDCAEVREDLTQRKLKTGDTEFMLWKDGNMAVSLSHAQLSDFMIVLGAMVVLGSES